MLMFEIHLEINYWLSLIKAYPVPDSMVLAYMPADRQTDRQTAIILRLAG